MAPRVLERVGGCFAPHIGSASGNQRMSQDWFRRREEFGKLDRRLFSHGSQPFLHVLNLYKVSPANSYDKNQKT
jgi:hypothetical protein